MSMLRASSRNSPGDRPRPRRGEVTGQRHHPAAGQAGEAVAGGGVRDARQRVRGVARADQAPDPRGGGVKQFAQQVSPEEPGRSGQEDLQRPVPVRPPGPRTRVGAAGSAQFRLPGEVDPRLVAVGGQPARPGVLRRPGEPPQRRVAQQAAGERAHVVRADAEHDPGVRQHLRGQQRVPAEREEVVLEADLLLLQQPGPQVGQPGLRRRAPLLPVAPWRGDSGDGRACRRLLDRPGSAASARARRTRPGSCSRAAGRGDSAAGSRGAGRPRPGRRSV